MISIFPIGSLSVKVVLRDPPRTFEFGVRFGRGRGRSFNTFTRYYLCPWGANWRQTLWEGRPLRAPEPMDPSERRTVYDWIEHDTRARKWLERKILAVIGEEIERGAMVEP